METEERKPPENEMKEKRIEIPKPPYKRICQQCGRKTLDENETICIECGASTRIYEDK